MKEFQSIREIDTSTNAGKLLLGAMSILSSTDFKTYNDYGYGDGKTNSELIIQLVELTDHIYNYKYVEYNKIYVNIGDYIDICIDEGKMLLTCIDILTSDECKNGKYGSHMNVDDVLSRIRRKTLITNRSKAIDLIIK